MVYLSNVCIRDDNIYTFNGGTKTKILEEELKNNKLKFWGSIKKNSEGA